MKTLTIKQLSELNITITKGSDVVNGCYRNVVLNDLKGNESYEVTLTGGDALVPLEVDQQALVDLRCDSYNFDGEWKCDYYVMDIRPLDKNTKVVFKEEEDWNTHLV